MTRKIFTALKRRFEPSSLTPLLKRQIQETGRRRVARLYTAFRSAPQSRHFVPKVAVVGGGLAGLSAAYWLQKCGLVDVTLYEKTNRHGGRVRTMDKAGRLIEVGAELIGACHHNWIEHAKEFGLSLNPISNQDDLRLQGIQDRVRIDRVLIEERQLHSASEIVAEFRRHLERKSADVNVNAPWLTSGAQELDNRSIQMEFMEFVHRIGDPRMGKLAAKLVQMHFSNDNATDWSQQSLLACLTQIKGGGGELFWELVEYYRCAEGNDSLAARMLGQLQASNRCTLKNAHVTSLRLSKDHVELRDTSSCLGSFDFVILAIPCIAYKNLELNGSKRKTIPIVGHGHASKYVGFLEECGSRPWLREGASPCLMDNQLGITWESTDGQQMDKSALVGVTVFAGGPCAETMNGTDPDRLRQRVEGAFLEELMLKLCPKKSELYGRDRDNIWHGYSCPAPGQVTSVIKSYSRPLGNRIFLAGEHTSPAFFGYMEGALATGVNAARKLVAAV